MRPIYIEDWRRYEKVFPEREATEVQQLMRLAPLEEPTQPTLEESAVLKEVVGEAIGALGAEDKFIFNLLFVEELSLRKAAAIVLIPKTTLARRRDKIRRRLMLDLSLEPVIQNWLYRDFRIPVLPSSSGNNDSTCPSMNRPTSQT